MKYLMILVVCTSISAIGSANQGGSTQSGPKAYSYTEVSQMVEAARAARDLELFSQALGAVKQLRIWAAISPRLQDELDSEISDIESEMTMIRIVNIRRNAVKESPNVDRLTVLCNTGNPYACAYGVALPK